MIHSISVDNFYSIENNAKLDFTVSNKAPQDNTYAETGGGTRVSLIEALIGPNASGKTNLMRALPFFKWLVADSFQYSPDKPLPFRTFANNDKPSKIEAVFEINAKVYKYKFVLTKERILSEKLKVSGRSNKRTTSKILFTRDWQEDVSEYTLNARGFNSPVNFKNIMRQNASLVSTGHQFNHSISSEIVSYWETHDTNVIESGWLNDEDDIYDALKYYEENPSFKARVEKKLREFDLGFDAFNFIVKEEGTFYRVAHKFDDRDVSLPLQYESSGTRQLFILLFKLFTTLDSGGILVIDEFDANLHPEVVGSLVDLFADPEENPNKSQILLSTHSLTILSQLDKYQIILVEKGENGSTESWRLDEIENVRSDDNFFAKYLSGTYGAIPRIG